MIKPIKFFFFLIFAAQFSRSIKLPSYMKPCKISDPQIKKCILKSTQDAVPTIIQGDKKLRIKPLDPYTIPTLDVHAGTFQIHFKNLSATGIKNIEIKAFNIDFVTNTWSFVAFVPFLTLLANYDIKGNVLFVPVLGHGPSNVTFADIKINYVLENEIIEKNNENYLNISHSSLTCEVSRMYTTLNNLFNGNKMLGDELHRLVNENWQEVYKDVAGILNGTLHSIATNSFKNVFKLVPLKEMFLD